MTQMQGFFFPRTASGRASLIPSPPWYYSGDLLTVEYRTDPARVAELLPAPLELAAEDPGAVALIWADWQSCSASREELLDPVRSQYKECFVVVRCSYRGHAPTPGASTSGSTRTSRSPAACTRATRRSWARCGRPGRTPSRTARRRSGPAGSSAPPWPPATDGSPTPSSRCARSRRPTASSTATRWPTTGSTPRSPAPGDAYAELIESGGAEFAGGPSWSGDVEVNLYDSPTEELSRLTVDEIIGGYYRQVGVVWNGGTSLETLTLTADLAPLLSRVGACPTNTPSTETERATSDRVGHLALDFPAAHAMSSLYRAANAARAT